MQHDFGTPSSNGSVVVSFLTDHTLATQATPPGAGSISASPSSPDGYYNANETIQLVAIPTTGFQFQGWSGDLSGSVNIQQIVMSTPRSVTANFTPIPCVYSLSSVGASVAASGGTRSVNVTATHIGCAWSAASSVSWIAMNAGTMGNGNGTVSFLFSLTPLWRPVAQTS